MKIRFVLFFVLMISLNACLWGDGDTSKPKPDITTDTLTYTYKTIKERAADCGTKPDSGCTVVKIKYPVFNNQPVLNDTLAKNILMLYSGGNPDDKPAKNLQELAANFIERYKKDNPQKYSPGMFYTLNLTASVVRQDSNITTLQLNGYNYEGGAHGSTITTFVNWNTKTNKNIYLKEIFINGYEDKLTAIADTIFRAQEKLTADASLVNDYFFTHHKFALNNNFAITPIGLKFLYNEYEIKPYAAGQTVLSIPYAKIKTLLRPNTVITQYLK
jgi:hypothetical protein